MARLFSFLKPYRLASGVALGLMLVELFVELVHPLLMARIIDQGILAQDNRQVWVWGGIMVGLAIFGFICGIVSTFFASHTGQHFSFDVREALFTKIQTFSGANFDRFSTSTLMTRLTSDMNQIQTAVFLGLRVYVRSPLMIVGSLVMAVIINVKLALLLLLLTPIVLFVLSYTLRKGFDLYGVVQRKLDRTNGLIREVLTGIRLIRVSGRGDYEKLRFENVNGELTDSTLRPLRLIEIVLPILLLLMNASVIFVVWRGHGEIVLGHTPLGEVIAIINYSTRIIASFSIVSMMVNNLSRAKAAVNRVVEVFEAKAEVSEQSDVVEAWRITQGKVEFQEVSFSYTGSRGALESASFTAQPGEVVAIMGATGSGKTSLLQLITRLYDPTEGCILIDDKDIRQVKLSHLRSDISYVTQEVTLFSGTIKDNVLWGKEDASLEEVIEAASHAQIHETIMKFPQQYDTMVDQKGASLSGGQRQRLSIARALLRKPKLLLLDDCTSALDVKTEARLMTALKSYRCTTVLVTQKVSAAQEADRILLLEHGKLLAQGTHEQLVHTSPLYQQIVASQQREEVMTHV